MIVMSKIIDKLVQKLILIFDKRLSFPEIVRSDNFILNEIGKNFLQVRFHLNIIDGLFVSWWDWFLLGYEPTVVK